MSVTDVSASSGACVLILSTHREDNQVYCVKENEGANVLPSFSFFFSISHSFVMHMYIFRQRFPSNYLT